MQTRSYRHLTAEEPETVSLGLAQGHSLRAMARSLGRAPSTLSRGLAKNRAPHQPYRACTPQAQAATRAQQPRRRNSWIPGCGNTCGLIWGTAVRPNRSPDGSYASILTTCRSTALPKPFTSGCMYCRWQFSNRLCRRHHLYPYWATYEMALRNSSFSTITLPCGIDNYHSMSEY